MEEKKLKPKKRNRTNKSKGNGQGTIYYSEVLDKYVAQYVEKGTGIRKTLTQRKNEGVGEFKKRFNHILDSMEQGTYISKNNITIYQLGLEIIENKFKRNKISEASYKRELGTLDLIKNSNIKNIQIQKATNIHLQNFIDDKKIYSNSYIDKIYELLGRIFREALKRDYILKNPLLKVEKPKSIKENKKIEAFSIEEQQAFLNILTPNEQYRDIFIIALYTGMRMGEILALQKDDIDFKENVIHIRRSLTKNKDEKPILGNTTKTYHSIRDIPINSLFKEELIHAINNMRLNIYNLLFIQSNGSLINVSNMNSRFKRLCVNANIGTIPYIIKRGEKEIHSKTSIYNQHMLRHTYATRMIEAGVPAEVLQKLLGHKDIQTTINTYTTIFDKFKRKEVDKYVDYIQNIN